MSDVTKIRINTSLLIFALTSGAAVLFQYATIQADLTTIKRDIAQFPADHERIVRMETQLADLNTRIRP